MRRFKFVVQNITAKIVYTRICMGTIQKIRTDVNVLHAAIHRIEWLFETFSSVCLSFSGGKDSTVLLHLTYRCGSQEETSFLCIIH